MRCAERRRRLALLFPLALGVATPEAGTLAPVQRQHVCMGTVFNIVAYHDEVAQAEEAVQRAVTEITRLDAVMSHYRPDSDLSRLNRDGAAGYVTVDPSLVDVVERALAVSRASRGRFDVTVGPLLRVWREAFEAGRQPRAAEIAAARRCVGYERIELRKPDAMRFTLDCLELDLGGIGKGYAVDRALGVLTSAGIRHAIVNAGGSTMRAVGTPPGLGGWPVDLGTSVSGHRTVLLRDDAISTSQQRVRFLPFGDGSFGEIIDPGRGAPVASETLVSVITTSAARADALSTTLLLMPAREGKQLLARFSPSSAVWVSPSGALQDSFRTSHLRLADIR